jgi:acetate kinase
MPDRILTINGGSSSIKFALFTTEDPPARQLTGQIERIGTPDATLIVGETKQRIEAADFEQAAVTLIDWLRDRAGGLNLLGVGHRIVHGGMHLTRSQIVDDRVLVELKKTVPLDLPHLPLEIALIEAFQKRFPDLPQIGCFDTAFHAEMPRVAKLLPIPRKYDEQGLRKFGFHGLSYTYLLDELRRIAPAEANGRVIFAHLGAGASMAAVRGGKPIDTTMGLTPLCGLVMGSRGGDLDPGLLLYLMRQENLSPDQMDHMLSHDCGLRGVSQTSGDMRDLLARRATDVRAAEAIELFCYRARQWIGALAASLGGLDTLAFSGGIGERSPQTRAEICAELEFLGLKVEATKNAAAEAIISDSGSRVIVRVMKTDEEIVIAKAVRAELKSK